MFVHAPFFLINSLLKFEDYLIITCELGEIRDVSKNLLSCWQG